MTEAINATTGEIIPVHPVAALFPMMSDEELDDLAADIKANGLVHPIIRDADGVLIDGRNRLEACRRAGVEPAFASLNGHDPVAFILSANVSRRHLTVGQRAMAVAQAAAFSKSSLRQLERESGVDNSRIAYARVVLQYAPELASVVMAGASLNEAYEEARSRKQAAEAAQTEADRQRGELERLRAAASDLADLVVEERMTLEEALAALEHREERERQQREAALHLLFRGIAVFDPNGSEPELRAAGLARGLEGVWVTANGGAFATLPDGSRLTEARLSGCLAVLTSLYETLYGDK